MNGKEIIKLLKGDEETKKKFATAIKKDLKDSRKNKKRASINIIKGMAIAFITTYILLSIANHFQKCEITFDEENYKNLTPPQATKMWNIQQEKNAQNLNWITKTGEIPIKQELKCNYNIKNFWWK